MQQDKVSTAAARIWPSLVLIVAFAAVHFFIASLLFLIGLGLSAEAFDDLRPPSTAYWTVDGALKILMLPLVTPLGKRLVSLPCPLSLLIVLVNSVVWGCGALCLLVWVQRRSPAA